MATLFRIDADRLALIVTNPARSTGDFRPGLQARFGLTATEADLVNDLICGETVRNYADTHEIAYETARTHLKNAMSKNGFSNSECSPGRRSPGFRFAQHGGGNVIVRRSAWRLSMAVAWQLVFPHS